ncbi:MAG: hypothetical protein LBR68_03455, partial [Lachnoclostridium sp.]|nr:hypothetical protein [Lachnoclostridium sp.]
MKINSSNVAMSSAHQEQRVSIVQSSTTWSAAGNDDRRMTANNQEEAAQLSFSERAKEMIEKQRNDKLARESGMGSLPDKFEVQKQLMEKLMELIRMLRGGRERGYSGDLNDLWKDFSKSRNHSTLPNGVTGGNRTAVSNGTWEVTTKMSSFRSEQEVTSFKSVGNVVTADG